MHTKNFTTYDCAQCQTIEDFSTASPDIQTSILSDTFIIKSINLSDYSRLMVSTQKCDSVFVSNLKCNQQQESLDAILSPVNIVAHKNIISIWRETSNLKQLQQVIKLSMNISTNCYRGRNFDNIRLIFENFFSLFTKFLNCVFLDFFPFFERGNYLIEILSTSHKFKNNIQQNNQEMSDLLISNESFNTQVKLQKEFPTLQSLALDVVAKNYYLYPQLNGLNDRVKQTIIQKSINYCSDSLENVLIAAPHINQQKYWKVCCERNRRTFTAIKLQDHGFSYKIAFLEKFIETMIEQCDKYQGMCRQNILKTAQTIYPWIFNLQMRINANDLRIDEIMNYLPNVINLRIKSVQGKNPNYKKKIIGMKFSEARDLSSVLKNSSNLISLNLTGNLIDDELFEFIAPGLSLNTSLVELNLSYNKLGDESARKLSKILIKNQVLTHLNLANNTISYEGSRYLAQALKLNNTLECLNLKLNSLDDKAGAKFFKDLTFNTNLKILDIQANLLSAMTVRKLCLYLQIFIGNNNFNQSDFQVIKDSLPSEKSKDHFQKSKHMQIRL